MREDKGLPGSTADCGGLTAVLDVCCGSRMFHFNKQNPTVTYGDIRSEYHTLCDGRALNVCPDVLLDFKAIPYPEGSFAVVVFDPPHLLKAGKASWLRKKYGVLSDSWRDDLRAGFKECFRVLKPDGVLIFKWCEDQIPVREILALTDRKPLIGHISGKRAKTHWLTFVKSGEPCKP